MYNQPPHGQPQQPAHPPPPGHASPPGYPPPSGHAPPSAYGQPGYGQPGPAQVPQYGPAQLWSSQAGYVPPGKPPKKRMLPKWVGFAVGAVLIAAGTGGPAAVQGIQNLLATPGEHDLGSGSPTDPLRFGINIPAAPVTHHATDVPGLVPGPTVDEAALAAVDPRQLYWAVLARQVTDIVSGSWRTPEEYREQFPYNVMMRHVGIDRRTREFVDESFVVEEDGTAGTEHELSRCLGNEQSGMYFPDNPAFGFPVYWKVVPSEDGLLCGGRTKPGKVISNSGSGDGIPPAGLTPEEMDAFISFIDGVPGGYSPADRRDPRVGRSTAELLLPLRVLVVLGAGSRGDARRGHPGLPVAAVAVQGGDVAGLGRPPE